MRVLRILVALAAVAWIGSDVQSALAGVGQPSEWQLGFQQAATPVISGVLEKYALLEPGVFEVTASFTVTKRDGTRQELACQARHSEGVIEVMIKTAMRNCIQQFILSAQEAAVF